MPKPKKHIKLQLSLKPFQMSREFRRDLLEQLVCYGDHHLTNHNVRWCLLRYARRLMRAEETLRDYQTYVEEYAREGYGHFNKWTLAGGGSFRNMCYAIRTAFEANDEEVTQYNLLPHIYEAAS